MSDPSPQRRSSEVQEEAPEAKIAKLKADVNAAEVAVNGNDATVGSSIFKDLTNLLNDEPR